jgi:flagellar hook protein FlgE
MTLQTALSGLLGAQTGLDTVSNDLANANSTAYKNQTALFEDLYPAYDSQVPGIGTKTEQLDENFTQGNLLATGNPLDAAIQGNGFFVVQQPNGAQQYTRDGAFQINATTGTLETVNGAQVLGYQTGTGLVGSSLAPITINTGAVTAKASDNLGLTFNLNSGDTVIPAAATFNAADPTTYDESSSVVAYDSLGNANRLGLYFVENPPASTTAPSTWTVYAQPQLANGTNVGTPNVLTTLSFSNDGALTSGSPATYNVTWGNGSAAQAINVKFAGTTLGAQSFALTGITNDGWAPGAYTGTSITSTGEVQSTYSNGQTVNAGILGIANFLNPEGLTPQSDNLFTESATSGQPATSQPGTGLAGTLQGGNLEASNASTSSLLISLIQYQQAYQANTSVIQTEQQDSQRLVQI